MSGSSEPLLSVRDLHVHFDTDEGVVRAVDGVSFDVERGETVCVVGESGSGKTVTCESITQLIPMPPGRIAGGEVLFDGMNLAEFSEKELRSVRGDRIAHVFQNPQGALNPVYTVGTQIIEAIRLHRDVSKAEARARSVDLLDRVGIPDAAARVDDYPHEFSGGMKQRVVIAMALASDPDLLIADEPTTALDVTIQAQILRLLNDLQAEYDMSIVFVTHDLGVVAEIADRVVVMYAGKVMERGGVFDVFEDPAHPYTQGLLDCLPGTGGMMNAIQGSLPDLTDPPDGCRFNPRCPHAVEDCRTGEQPAHETVADDHDVSCVYYRAGYDESVVRRTDGRGDSESESGAARTDGGGRDE
ncbi:ABC transporter ATP-binding protein [Halomarina litorea]|uniref:ABC transporter ATP-binding protein n=1 Tax=Halomarina litorea TaxID=2961595 RepID=UPI0020C269E1|nr:ABC transporter ATP-binding protein [Halomarina sp. BCD28]